ncbi:MAG: type II secretion system protein [Acidobacteriota bacterium]
MASSLLLKNMMGNKKGFSLIETLMVFSLFIICFLVFLRTIAHNKLIEKNSKENLFLLECARNKIEEIQIGSPILEKSEEIEKLSIFSFKCPIINRIKIKQLDENLIMIEVEAFPEKSEERKVLLMKYISKNIGF